MTVVLRDGWVAAAIVLYWRNWKTKRCKNKWKLMKIPSAGRVNN